LRNDVRTFLSQPATAQRRSESTMGIGVSVFLIAVGAILSIAHETGDDGINLDTVGVILMIVGAIGLLMSMLFWSSFAPFGGGRSETVVREERY
jgi:hypothetical protein